MISRMRPLNYELNRKSICGLSSVGRAYTLSRLEAKVIRFVSRRHPARYVYSCEVVVLFSSWVAGYASGKGGAAVY